MSAPEGTLVADSFEVYARLTQLETRLTRLSRVNYENGQRKGQSLFNALSEFAPELAELIRGTPEDPFNDDDRIPSFIHALFGDRIFVTF